MTKSTMKNRISYSDKVPVRQYIMQVQEEDIIAITTPYRSMVGVVTFHPYTTTNGVVSFGIRLGLSEMNVYLHLDDNIPTPDQMSIILSGRSYMSRLDKGFKNGGCLSPNAHGIDSWCTSCDGAGWITDKKGRSVAGCSECGGAGTKSCPSCNKDEYGLLDLNEMERWYLKTVLDLEGDR